MSDLKHNLEALLIEDSWLPPPSTPILHNAELYSPGEDPPCFPVKNLMSSPQDTEPHIQVSTSSVSDFSSMSVDTHKGSDQHMTDEHLLDESPIAQAPINASVADSPYTRIKELVKGSFRKVFSTSPQVTPSDSINTNAAHGAMDISIKDHDTSSQMGGLNHSSSLRILRGS